MFFKEAEITSCDEKQNILQLNTKKQLSYDVICILNSGLSKAAFILTSLN